MWKNIHISCFLVFIQILVTCQNVSSQEILENLLELIPLEPELGSWSLYEVKDKSTNTTLLLREAITDEEIVESTKCFWLETEVIPTIGFPSVYRFLIQPEKEGRHKILKIVAREGANLPETYNHNSIPRAEENKKFRKKLIDEGIIEYKSGKIEAKHYNIKTEDKEIDIWVTPKVKPLGIVKLNSKDGEMLLVKFGKGGVESKSTLELNKDRGMEIRKDPENTDNVNVKVEM